MAQIVIQISADQEARIRAAFGRVDGLTTQRQVASRALPPIQGEEAKTEEPVLVSEPRSATLEEVEKRVRDYIISLVHDQEAAVAREAAASSVAKLAF